MDKEIGFGIVDYCAFVGMLAVSSGIGFYISYKGSKSPEEFLMGNRSFKTFPVSMSLLTSYISAVSLLGFPGEAYGNGMQMSTSSLGTPLAIIFSTIFILPIYFPLKLTSINEYIELRFKSKRLRYALFFLSAMKTITAGGIVLYAPTLALSPIIKIGTLNIILILGVICTLYSAFGGIKAVIWTDVFQFSVMLTGMVAVLAVGCAHKGGLINILHIASEGERLEFFKMSLSPFIRHTFFNTIVSGFFSNLRLYSSDQVFVQRICTVNSIKRAKRVLRYNIFGKLTMYFLTYTCGLVAYATYAGCDPMALGKIKKKDEIMPYFIMDKLSFIPGFPGLFVATVLGASLSTLSSYINSVVALLWKDVCLKFEIFKNTSEFKGTFINKMLSIAVGAVLTGFAIAVSNTKGLMELGIICSSVLSGPILGVFLIGFFLPQCNLKGVYTAVIGTTAASLWLVLGGVLYKKPTKLLPFSADECLVSNFSSVNISSLPVMTASSMNITDTDDMSFLISLYQISYTLYGCINVIICILLASLVSWITGNLKSHEVSPKYVSPYVHKFFWTKRELEEISKKEYETNIDLGKIEDNEDQSL